MSDNEIGTVNPTTFEWVIPSIRKWLDSGCCSYLYSPDFHEPKSSWFLRLFSACEEWMGVYLYRADSGAPKTITYTIKIRGKTGVSEFTKTNHFSKNTFAGKQKFLKKAKIQQCIFWDSIAVTCYIKCNISHPMPGKLFVIPAVQTEVPDSTPYAIQTEAANTVIDKKSYKDEEWSSHDTKGVAVLSEHMKQMLIKGEDQDVTICVQNKEFRAHRNILSARSPVFAMMLAHDTKENNTGTINIEDCDPGTFHEFLLYVYSGRTENLTPNNVLQLYYPADKYDFPVLKERCVSLMKTSLSVESICDVILLAAKHQEKELLEVATEFFVRNMKKIVVTVGWQKFMAQNPVEANELIIKSMDILRPED